MPNIVLIRTPFKIRYGIVLLIAIFVVYNRKVQWIWNEYFRNKAVNKNSLRLSSVLLKDNPYVIACFITQTHYFSGRIHLKALHPPHVADLVHALPSWNIAPNLTYYVRFH